MHRFYIVVLVALVLLPGCAGKELSPVNPAGVDLSGEWFIDNGDSDQVPDLRNHRPGKAKRSTRSSVRGEARRIGDGSGLAFVAHDFQVLRATALRIELNRDSMGIRYTPGVYRDISWGERQRGLWEVTAGWDANDLVIDSEARNLKVRERFVRAGADELEVQVSIEADGEKIDYTRSFKRSR